MSDYNKDNAKGRYIPDRDEFATQYMPGDWSFDFDGDAVVAILLSTPDGSPRGTFVRLPLTGNGALACSGMLFIGGLTFAAVAWGYRQLREANRGANE
jgi:hypothetical protein